ncbi:MAG: helix-turn-helix domain-containing protein, partial [Thermomonas sp.]
ADPAISVEIEGAAFQRLDRRGGKAAAEVARIASGQIFKCLRQHIAEIENELIRQALQQTGGVVAHAAPLLGLRRTTLLEKLRKYGIVRSGDAGPEDDVRES